ncbi:hypothetical protein Rsub_10382 [Raphidocelis subcapitata]|uniref:Uncharacterized protein n=1 Tax=Raphidocelis subcapitata TaxID=307507 RepID=A0A2V0PD70_9CHLO|nr:hypothetical protein Rsub_10382 [Raphidocelis subcapitata]|eukprot:GBF97459.1 hypothetical protein Rsub_10382 [Raphidocelis subcapitata]
MLPLLLLALSSRADAARLLAQLVETHVVRENPRYAPQIATTLDGFGGEAAALANPNSAGVYVQAGEVHSAGDLLPGPTGRVSSAAPTAANGGAVAQSGLGEMPVISTGDMAAASVYGAGGAAVAVAAPNAFYVGGGTHATATADATGLYGGSKAIANSWVGGELPGKHWHRDEFGDVMGTRAPQTDSGGSAFRRAGALGAAGWGGEPYFGGGGTRSQTSFSGAQQFESVSYGASGIRGPIAVAAAGQALAVSQSGI